MDGTLHLGSKTGCSQRRGSDLSKKISPAKQLFREREIAFKILLKALGPQKANLHESLAQAEGKFGIEGSAKGLLRQLVLGVVQWKARLEWIVASHFSGFYKAPLPVRVLMLMGAYQIVMLDRIPFYAAVNETVKLFTSNLAPTRYKPILNGVLREIARAPYPHVGGIKTLEDAISVAYSHPRWLVRRWLKRFGAKETVALCRANCHKAPFSIRVNTKKITPKDLRKLMRELDVECMLHPVSPEMLIVLTPVDISKIPPFQNGLFLPQDLSSWLVPVILDPRPGDGVLDCCAAPGIKTTQMVSMMGGEGEILAVERDEGRFEALAETCSRWGADIVRMVRGDIREVAPQFSDRKFKRVLVDAPCSDLGVIRRHPEIRWRRKSSDLKVYAQAQLEILTAVAPLVEEGGILVYSVCSTEPEEGEQVISKFLKKEPRFVLDKIIPFLPDEVVEKGRVGEGTLFLAPHLLNTDGFFIARLKRE